MFVLFLYMKFCFFYIFASKIIYVMLIEVNGIGFELDASDKCAAVVKGEYSGNIVIPANVHYNGADYYVSAISESAFEGCLQLTSVSTPESLRAIGASAFKGCSSLIEVYLNSDILVIGAAAFSGCSGLVRVELPANLVSIEASLFDGCSSLKEVVIGENIDGVGEYAFCSCSSLTELSLPQGV